MDRRDFIKKAGLAGVAASGIGLLESCGNSSVGRADSANGDSQTEGAMTYRTNNGNGDKVSILGYGCMRLPEIEENGTTFAENATIKARAAAESGYIGVGDDSGLEVDALGGAPGVYSARYCGRHGDDEANNDLLLANLSDKEDKSAHYTCAMVIAYPCGKEICAEGYMYGRIVNERRGNGGFGYDPIFVADGEERTVAEMTEEEKNAISHRAKALEKILEML